MLAVASPVKGFIAGILAVFIWALTPSLTKLGVRNISPPLFLILRYGISTVLLLPFLLKLKINFKKIGIWPWALFFLAVTTHLITYVFALKDLPASWYILFFSVSPILSIIFIKRQILVKELGFFMIAALGSLLFIAHTKMGQLPSSMAFMTLILSVVAWVVITILIVRFQKEYSDQEITALGNLFTFLSSIFFVIFNNNINYTTIFHSNVIGIILVLSIMVPTGFFLFSYSMRRTPVFGVAAQYLELVFGLFFAFLIFNEPVVWQQLIGAMLVIMALIGVSMLKE